VVLGSAVSVQIAKRDFLSAFLLKLFLVLAWRISVFVLFVIDIGFIGIYLNTDIVTKPHLYSMRQRCGNMPVRPFKVKI
jgi:hypothetical protein